RPAPQSTIESVKVKLSFHCGTSASAMALSLLDEGGATVASMWEDNRKLGFYSPHNGYTIHITDTDPGSLSAGGWLEDTSLVEKYRMSDTDYDKREKSYRKWKNEKVAGDPSWTLEKEMAMRRGVEYVPPPPKVRCRV
ncbi:Tubulin-specific chaperone B, partial [Tetrabaena socialis]